MCAQETTQNMLASNTPSQPLSWIIIQDPHKGASPADQRCLFFQAAHSDLAFRVYCLFKWILQLLHCYGLLLGWILSSKKTRTEDSTPMVTLSTLSSFSLELVLRWWEPCANGPRVGACLPLSGPQQHPWSAAWQQLSITRGDKWSAPESINSQRNWSGRGQLRPPGPGQEYSMIAGQCLHYLGGTSS